MTRRAGKDPLCPHALSLEHPREWNSWRAMRRRCLVPTQDGYERYGGRGVTVCSRWLYSFENFLHDMGPRPPETTLDRYPNGSGDYEPGNCRWASQEEQSANRRWRGRRTVRPSPAPRPTAPLTTRQLDVVEAIRERLRLGAPPTRRELAADLDVSLSCVHSHVDALARAGHVLVDGGSARGIRLRDDAPAECAESDVPLGAPTAAQVRVLLAFVSRSRADRRHPTVRELSRSLGFTPSGATDHLAALVRKGFLVRPPRTMARGLRLSSAAAAWLSANATQTSKADA